MMSLMGTNRTLPPLTRERVQHLLVDPSAGTRAETAASVAAEFSGGTLSERERRIAIRIFEILARDVERQVRESLAEHVKNCPYLPRSVARTLAEDVESVALPIIRYSEALTDEDLIAIVRSGNARKQLAVAERQRITPRVADSLVDTGNQQVIGTLLANHGADIPEGSLDKVMDSFTDDGWIHALLIERPTLPLHITERLMTRVSAEFRQRIIERHHFPPDLADEVVMHGKERALTRMLEDDDRLDEMERLAATLYAKNALTPTLVFRALCVGDLHFFEAAMATLAHIPIDNARALIYEEGRLGLKRLYQSTQLPPEMYRAFRAAVDVVLEVRKEEGDGWRRIYTERILGRLVRDYDDISPEGLEHVVSQLSRRVNREAGTAA